MEYAIKQLSRFCRLPTDLIEELTKRVKTLEVPRNTTLLLTGDICDHIWLIEKGTLVCFDTHRHEKYCTWIMTEGDFVTAVESFNNQTVSTETITAVTRCRLYALKKADFEWLTRYSEAFRDIRQQLTDKYHIQSRVLDAKRKRSPRQFYTYLRDHHPEILKETPITILASFMGISRPTLYQIINNK